jgi:hypothetical protein
MTIVRLEDVAPGLMFFSQSFAGITAKPFSYTAKTAFIEGASDHE